MDLSLCLQAKRRVYHVQLGGERKKDGKVDKKGKRSKPNGDEDDEIQGERPYHE